MRAMRQRLALALLAAACATPALAVWSCGGSLPGPQVCSERQTCEQGRSCVLGRCRKDKTIPVSLDAPRLTFPPIDLAWIHGGEVQGPTELGEALVLGRQGEADSLLLLRFAVSIPEDARLQRALLWLEPLPRCERRPGRVAFEVAQVLSPWRSSGLAGGERPDLSLPMYAAEASVTPPQPLRIDVTELVKAWAERRDSYHGLALSAAGDGQTGACYASGVTWGRGPELRVFLWPEEPDAGSDAGDAGDGSTEAGSEAGAEAGSEDP